MFFSEIADVRAAGFEDPQPEQTEHRDQREVVRVVRQPRGGDQGSEATPSAHASASLTDAASSQGDITFQAPGCPGRRPCAVRPYVGSRRRAAR